LSERLIKAMRVSRDLTEQFHPIEPTCRDDPDESAAYLMTNSGRVQLVAVEQLLHLRRTEQVLNRMSEEPETSWLYVDTVELHLDNEA
jgi:hypothetical protein